MLTVSSFLLLDLDADIHLPLLAHTIPAGTPDRVDDLYADESINLNRYLVRNPNTTFFVRVAGESMVDANIHHGDILVVDRSLTPTNGSIVVAYLDGELTVKRLQYHDRRLHLVPANHSYKSISIHHEAKLEILGVVTFVIHKIGL